MSDAERVVIGSAFFVMLVFVVSIYAMVKDIARKMGLSEGRGIPWSK